MGNKNYTIYKVTNITNNKCYIGLTSRDFETRRYEHIYESKSESVFKFHQALRKYSYDNFRWEILESGLPTKALRNSYYNNGKPIYLGKTIKKEILLKNQNFIGWYAIKINQ